MAAGKVIEAFGQFVVGGNYVVGFVLFLALVAIQFLVVSHCGEGKVYFGTVKKIMDFGAFVEILPGTDGLVHISQLDNRRVERVEDVLKEGDELLVKCIGIDPKTKKIKLSRKEALGLNIADYKKL